MKITILIIICLIAGVGVGFGSANFLDKPTPAKQTATKENTEDPQTELSGQILSSLRKKKGDEFDKAFLTELMSHNQTAIEMASLAQERTEREEIKKWAKYVSDAQISDISQMKTWYNDWGFLKQDQENNPHEGH